MLPLVHDVLPRDTSEAERIASVFDEDLGDFRFRRNTLSKLPDSFALPVARTYVDLYQDHGRRAANLYILDVEDELAGYGALRLASNDDDLISKAKELADRCTRYRHRAVSGRQAVTDIQAMLVSNFHLQPTIFQRIALESPVTVTATVTATESVTATQSSRVSVTGALNRLCDELWWRRTLRCIHGRNVEGHAIRGGIVQRNVNVYVSDESFKRCQQQAQRNIRTLQNTIATNERTGDEVTLFELAERSQANPKLRRGELMLRIRGFEESSKELGHVAMFYTVTCPSRMHACKSTTKPNGKTHVYRNKRYDNTTPREAQHYLSKLWTRVRAQLARDGIQVYGFRVVEPHHDGTPHWHLLLFVQPAQADQLTSVMRHYALQVDGDEPGATKHRFKTEKIDPKKGSATGYIAKYIAKGLDGYGLDVDLYDHDAKDSAKRIAAWAKTWGIRQFQQIGGPPVGLWRELRRLKDQQLNGWLEEVRQAADEGDWKSFMQLMGGPLIERKAIPLKIAKVWSDKENRYQEPKGYVIFGIELGNVSVPTRVDQWSLSYRRDNKIEARPKSNQRSDPDTGDDSKKRGD